MSKEAINVLVRAREEIIREIVRAGESGGTGRASNYSPILNNLHQSILILQELGDQPAPVPEQTFAQKMQAAKAAKKSSQ